MFIKDREDRNNELKQS